MSKVFVMGSINEDVSIEVPHFPLTGETVIGKNFARTLGGKGANQALAAACMGAQVIMVGAVGNDDFGKVAQTHLAQEKVDCSHILTLTDMPSGQALVWRCGADNRIAINHGANYHVSFDCVKKVIRELSCPEDIFLTQLECKPNAVFRSLRFAHEQGLYTILNAAPSHQIPNELFRCIDLLCCNENECEQLFGILPESLQNTESALRLMRHVGVDTAMLTLGCNGAAVSSEGIIDHVPPCPTKAIDSTGAGDACMGALAGALAQGHQWEDAIRLSMCAASVTCEQLGASLSSSDCIKIYRKFETQLS